MPKSGFGGGWLVLLLLGWGAAEGQQPAPAPAPAPALAPARAPASSTLPTPSPSAARLSATAPAQTPVAAPGALSKQATATQSSTGQPAAAGQAALAEEARQRDPRAVLVWSVPFNGETLDELPTEAEFVGLRSSVIVADRVVALFEISAEVSHGGRPLRIFRLISLDQKTGEVKDQKEIRGQSLPDLFATGDDHLILGHTSLVRLNPDLSESGERFTETGHGRTVTISPDGSVLARWAEGESELLDARTLTPTGVRIGAEGKWPEAAAVSRRAILTDDARWASQFPQELTFVALIDEQQPHLLYHGACGGRPLFLSEEKILFVGCGKATVIDSTGKVLKQFPLGASYGGFAGVSRDGSRFVIATTDYSVGDPSYKPDELFTIYNSETYETVATITPETVDEARSWSAFSQDGSLFVSGSPKRLSLYRIP